jgi:hypothetical protein
MEPDADVDLIPLDRWVIRLDDTPARPLPPAAPADPSPPELLRFPLDADVPSAEFQPRLLRFGKAG